MQTFLEARFPAVQSRWFIRETPAVSTRGPKFAFSLLIVFVLMLYSSVSIVLPQLNAFRPVLLVAAAALVTLAIELSLARQSLRVAPQTILLIAFLGVAVVSTFSALYVKKAFDTTFDFSKIILIYLVIENTVVSESRLRKIFWTLVLGGLFPAIGTIQHYFAGILIDGSRGSWVGVFKNPNEDAYCLAVLVPLAIALMYKSRWYVRVALAGIIAIDLVGIFFTFSRGGMLGLVAGLGLVGWKQKSYVIRVGMIVTLALGLAAAAAFWTRNQDFKNVSSDTTFKQRVATVIAGGRMFLDYPILGVGPGCSIVAYPLYVPTEYLDCGCQTQLVIHNSFVQVLSELGAPGFILFMALLGVSILDAWRMQSGPIAKYAGGIEIALWVFVVCSMSGGFTYTWSPYLLFGLVAATKRIRETLPSQGTPATT
jgi:putative inorganic carbon (HCO3(-)) transporter